MRRRWSQAGEGNIGCIIWSLIFLAVIGVSWKLVPIKIKAAELYDFMEDQARYTKRGKEDRVVKLILEKADDLDLPLVEDDLSVVRQKDNVTIEYYYMVEVQFPGYVYEWEFEGKIDRPSFVY